MKKLLLFFILLAPNVIQSEINTITERYFKTLNVKLVKFDETTYFTPAPDISELIKEKRKFFAELDSYGPSYWYMFENNEDIITLQKKLCYDGKHMTAKWYYADEADLNTLSKL